MKNENISRDMFEIVLSIMRKCTDDFLFMLDFKNDLYSISEEAIKQFDLPASKFSNIKEYIMPIVHPDDREMLNEDLDDLEKGRKSVHNLEYRWIDRNGKIVWISCRGEVVKDEDKTPGFMIGRIAQIGKKIKVDNLTGFFAEPQLMKDYNDIKHGRRDFKGAILKVGIDNLEIVNEKYGMNKSDEIIKILAQCISRSIMESNAYRVNDDEFIVLGWKDKTIQDMKDIFNKICHAIEKLNEEQGYKFFCSISGGIVTFPEDAFEYDDLQKKAEFAMNAARRRGKNKYFVYNEQDYKAYTKKLDIYEALRKSTGNNFRGFQLFYQPVIDAENGILMGAEALLRWESEEYGMMLPLQFIPILEENGLIIPIGRWIIKTAFSQCKKWIEIFPDFKIGINLSYVQIKDSDLFYDIISYMKECGISSKNIVFELKENKNMEEDKSVLSFVKRLDENDINVSVDDFGTGYLNLKYLRNFKVSTIKIDRSFVCGAASDEYDYKLIRHLIELAHSINLKVCLEGIEIEKEKKALEALKPDLLQGYLFGRPMGAEAFQHNFINSK